MKNKVLTLLLSMLCICSIYAEDDKIPIPPDQKWSDTNDRDNSSPELYQSESSVYVYSDLPIGCGIVLENYNAISIIEGLEY